MHLGVLATAWHAVSTGTMFTVYYKPRTSPAEFIVPFDQYMESVKNNHSIGMRFKMRFEGEEAPEQRFTGTIVGNGESDPNRWPSSKWRSLKELLVRVMSPILPKSLLHGSGLQRMRKQTC
ncbi:hypothetical protein MKW94_001605 [Papaver nudicaule]|uniref:Auxin response factor domain-containing protein n=1 Tax=Papaver nudicaule TaxID=74823 RepID=A0AA41S9Q8_PAPNU|nr:hypothetical protein [Papaver nudicaule]